MYPSRRGGGADAQRSTSSMPKIYILDNALYQDIKMQGVLPIEITVRKFNQNDTTVKHFRTCYILYFTVELADAKLVQRW